MRTEQFSFVGKERERGVWCGEGEEETRRRREENVKEGGITYIKPKGIVIECPFFRSV